MNCTLPAVAITAFAEFDRDFSLLLLVVLGFCAAVRCYFLMYFFSHKMKKETRVYYMISVSGFNVGCYGMPIIESFFGSLGTVICVMFDIGNSLMMTSGNYAFTSMLLKTDGEDTKVTVPELLKRFFSSVPTDTYLVLLVISFLGLSLPQGLVDFISPIASANAFLSMFMLGLLFTLPRQKSDWKSTLHILAFRLGILSVLAFVMFHVLPFSLEVRRIVVLLLLCLIGSMAPAFIEKCHGDGELAAFTNSISTLASLILMSVVAGYFQVH